MYDLTDAKVRLQTAQYALGHAREILRANGQEALAAHIVTLLHEIETLIAALHLVGLTGKDE